VKETGAGAQGMMGRRKNEELLSLSSLASLPHTFLPSVQSRHDCRRPLGRREAFFHLNISPSETKTA